MSPDDLQQSAESEVISLLRGEDTEAVPGKTRRTEF